MVGKMMRLEAGRRVGKKCSRDDKRRGIDR